MIDDEMVDHTASAGSPLDHQKQTIWEKLFFGLFLIAFGVPAVYGILLFWFKFMEKFVTQLCK